MGSHSFLCAHSRNGASHTNQYSSVMALSQTDGWESSMSCMYWRSLPHRAQFGVGIKDITRIGKADVDAAAAKKIEVWIGCESNFP